MSRIDIDYLKGWEGKTQQAFDDMSPFKARALAAALNHEHLPEAGSELPNGWQWLYFLDTPSSVGTGVDGHPATGGFLPPSPLPRRMWGAGRVHHQRPVILGEPAEKTSRVELVDLKDGKSGTLLFVKVRHDINQGGQFCIKEEQNIIYRDMPTALARLPVGKAAPTDAEWSETLQPDPVLLFRFSALTYNAHRIHYDRDYAMHSEFYPGLVVHGPLLATLLSETLVRQFPGEWIRDFVFRAERPTFDGHPVQLCGKREGGTVSLWSVDHEGFIGMHATAVMGAQQ
ncbi:acyl-CoA dehydrogenase [Haliea sp. E1-2-M8]|uniref:acyl-CoA dehydrogenase n=1 Tax=Haliea sp. E1-2-M8 TaxID=3064706 RepID=UPI0027288F46|nr:acyl-CoA dehydrogenase [Haliea sp. E1-2-M8]MDO8864099.1 acyl-CoA dehydrogenase [Haliea sp. E1-2-M8]